MTETAKQKVAPKIYAVDVKPYQGLTHQRLVKASSRTRAELFVAKDTISAHLAGQEELWKAYKAGLEVEDATGEPATQEELPL